MLAKNQRLTRALFDDIIKKSSFINSEYISVRFNPSVDGSIRFAAVAPAKIFKSAVMRNKQRRRLYKALNPLYKKSKDIVAVVFAKKGMDQRTIGEIEQELFFAFKKASLLA